MNAVLLPPQLAQILESELAPGERIVWQGLPLPGSRVRASLQTFFFGIPFFAFSVFWTWKASEGSSTSRHSVSGDSWPSWFPLVWGGMFVLAGARMLLSPLWVWWEARHTIYAITDRRALVIRAPWHRTVRSFTGERLVSVVRREDSRGRGDLVFEREYVQGRKGRTICQEAGFFGLANAREAEQFLPQAIAGSRKG